MARRQVFHASPAPSGWKVTQSGKTLAQHTTQKAAQADAIARAKAAELGQAVFHKKDGQISGEYTYGNDPRRHKG